MVDIKIKLKEVADYFKNKVLEGDFKFISCGDYTAKILIDGKFEFDMWISNDPKYSFKFYESSIDNIGDYWNTLLDFKSQKNRLKAWRQLKPHIDEYKNKVLLRDKRKKFNELKKELEKYGEY